jgi:uncharacterized RDD family membrane protein YckC
MRKCPHCGKEYPDDVAFCAIDESPLDGTNPEPVRNENKASAGFWIRVLARFIDMLLAFFVGYVAGIIGGIVLTILGRAGAISPGWAERVNDSIPMFYMSGLLGAISYHFLCEGIHGATLGKLCCRICVVTEDLQPSRMKGALIRTLAYYLDSFFFGAVGYTSMSKTPLNQRYGDVWGKTAVMKIKELPPESRRPLSVFFLGLLAGIGCYVLILVAGMILTAL